MMIVLALGPMLVFYLVWLIFPMLYSLTMSFYNWNPLSRQQVFLGAGNYREALFFDTVFWTAMLNSAVFSLVTVPWARFWRWSSPLRLTP